jgi:methylenetetrahydrofolate dehydrogenase (NADP+)/methenyltetrahydrofolate cyclohydrolase
MAAIIIDGKKVAEEIRVEIRERAALLAKRGIQPGLAVVLVGEDPASLSYVTGKEKACGENGIRSVQRRLPADCPEADPSTPTPRSTASSSSCPSPSTSTSAG